MPKRPSALSTKSAAPRTGVALGVNHAPQKRLTGLLLVSPQTLLLEALAQAPSLIREFQRVDVALTTTAAYGLTTRRPRVILLDRLLPGQPLRAVLGNLRRRSPDSRCVILADFPLPAYAADAAAAGAQGLVTRRLPLAQMVSALVEVGGGGSWFPTRVAKNARTPHVDPTAGLGELTPRELDVLLCLARAMTLQECALHLGLSRNTVDNHRTRLMAKLGVHRTIELAWLALREGLLTLW